MSIFAHGVFNFLFDDNYKHGWYDCQINIYVGHDPIILQKYQFEIRRSISSDGI